jgi:signal transduction histidine kinase/ActR/RegA family two-component response regulator
MQPTAPPPPAHERLASLFEAAWRDRAPEAEAPLLDALRHFEATEQPIELARCCLALTRLAEARGELRRCFELLDTGVAALSGLRERAGELWLKLLNYQGYLYGGTGQASAALAPLHAALHGGLRTGNESELTQAAINLACTLFDLGDHEGCEQYYRLVTERCPNLGTRQTVELLWVQARICHQARRQADLINVLQCISMRDTDGDPEGSAGGDPATERRMSGVERLVQTYIADLQEDWPLSAAHAEASWGLLAGFSVPAELFEVAWLAARAHAELGPAPQARTWADRAVQAATEGAPVQLPLALRLRARVRRAQGDLDGAFADADLALDWATRADPQGVAAALRVAIERHDDTVRELRDNETRAVADALKRVNRDLAAAKASAERAAQGRARFLASMSHELRTPLHGVLGAAELLANEPLSPPQRALTAIIQRSGRLTLSLVDDILDLRKAEEGQLQIDPVQFRLLGPIEDALALIGPKASEAGCGLRLSADPTLPPRVQGDDRRIQQVVLNLLSNAIRFGRGRPVEVALRPGAGDRVRITVQDHGPGVPKDDQQRIFDPYVQASASTARSHGGTGLGLSLCRQLVQAMGGELWLQSEPGQGATFGFELPLAASLLVENVPGIVNPGRLDGLRVLLADDDPVNLGVLRLTLESLGAGVEAVTDGRQAVEQVARSTFDLLILDMQMPEMDGPTATAALRAQGCTLPVLALTASVLPEDAAACLAAGMSAVATKPLTKDHLCAAVQALLRGASPSTIAR